MTRCETRIPRVGSLWKSNTIIERAYFLVIEARMMTRIEQIIHNQKLSESTMWLKVLHITDNGNGVNIRDGYITLEDFYEFAEERKT